MEPGHTSSAQRVCDAHTFTTITRGALPRAAIFLRISVLEHHRPVRLMGLWPEARRSIVENISNNPT